MPGICACVRLRANRLSIRDVDRLPLFIKNTSDPFTDIDVASEMKSRLSGAGFVVIGAQDLSVLGRAAAPAPATYIVEI
jgi:hypothetical protein